MRREGSGEVLESVEVSLGRGGGTRCTRCGRREEGRYRPAFEISAEVEAACDAWGDVPGPNVALTGPEPFGHPELPQLVSAAVRAGVKRLRLDTDAVSLGHPDNAGGVLAAGVRQLRVTLLAGSPGMHDALAGSPGVLDRTLQGVRAFADTAERADVHVAISAHIPVCRHNLHDLANTVSVAASAGACYVLLEIADPAIDPRSAMPWVAAACDTGTVNALWVEVAGMPYCFGGRHALHLVPVMRPVVVGAKAEACGVCALDETCGGLPAEAAPQAKAMLAPPAVEKQLAESIRRSYLSPSGPGELE
jgi:hypothetical protein